MIHTAKFASMAASTPGPGPGGEGAAPLKRNIVYVDSGASGVGAEVGNGVAFSDLSTAYVAALTHYWEHGETVNVHLAPGYYGISGIECYPVLFFIGSGTTTTHLDINNSGASITHLYGRDFMLDLTIQGQPGMDAYSATPESPGAGSGSTGQDVQGSVMGQGGRIALRMVNISSGSGSHASSAWDDGSSQQPGASGGNGGALDFRISGVDRLSDSWTLATGSPGYGSGGLYSGTNGASGSEGACNLFFAQVRNAQFPVSASALNVPAHATCRALDCHFGILSSATWLANACHFLPSGPMTSLPAGDGAPNYGYASGM